MNDAADSSQRQRVLDAALQLWAEKGYADSSMRELARRLGMGLQALYQSFPTQEHLVFALYESLEEEASRRFSESDEEVSDLGVAYCRFLQTKLSVLEPHREAMTAIFREAVDPGSGLSPLGSGAGAIRQRILGVLADLVRQGGIADPDQCERLARILWLLHLMVILYWLHDRSEASANTQRLIEKLRGIGQVVPLLGMVPEAEKWLELVTDLVRDPDSDPDPDPEQPAAEAVSTQRPLRNYDVVVIGAGPIGMLFASWLQQMRSQTSILVLERAERPGHKIGESTLSGFCKALRSVGIRHEVTQRLFYPKNGLGFFHVDEATDEVTHAHEYILETFDETFQVERRVLDTLLIANGRRTGIEVIQGATVDMGKSQIGESSQVVAYSVGRQSSRVGARLVIDASGPSRVLGRHLQKYTDSGVPFQSGAVWAYFKGVRPLDSYQWPRHSQFPRDEYTQHLCFREGWMWYIPLVSWQEAPDTNLDQMLTHLLTQEGEVPSQAELVDAFGCPSSSILSVGMVLRQDRDERLRDDPRAAFEYYRQKYPSIAQVLEGGELLEDHYGFSQSYSSRSGFRLRAPEVCGRGWLLVGDAAFFVDPLISPGLTSGAATAFHAAQASVRLLDEPDAEASVLADYEASLRQLHDALERDNQLVYMSFNHPEAMELIQRFQEIDARAHFNSHEGTTYRVEDTNVWGILDPDYQELQQQLYAIMRAAEQEVGVNVPVAEQSARDYEPMVTQIRECVAERLETRGELTPFVAQNRDSR